MDTSPDSRRDHCKEARENVCAGIDPSRRFPRNVFEGEWSDFLFFDSDWMTEHDFVDHIKLFLAADGAQCACLWKLDSENSSEPRFFFVGDRTAADEYLALLAGPSPAYGWLVAMERVACASDSGEWCMYCEPNNEIAVIGFRHVGGAHRYLPALAPLHATRFDVATREPVLSWGFSDRVLTPDWRDQMSREYATRSL